ncbi:fungal specific transcription factor domain-containing protein [Pochonia chlamydosporia 170]|uniref:Fungal specific transcription factor domain-containing protein n=1 Tax=Pochonia chlamydosporia 170 TaxID=1380566 RepID=A0A179EZC4_METCM|nr:fungal specific transcription factor domain-containing protein [Pochonia chlamydosporia 170]OAQ58193.2 fungal specific transcription factor domain-containing protein [Pochonia chlamydosporia 170]
MSQQATALHQRVEEDLLSAPPEINAPQFDPILSNRDLREAQSYDCLLEPGVVVDSPPLGIGEISLSCSTGFDEPREQLRIYFRAHATTYEFLDRDEVDNWLRTLEKNLRCNIPAWFGIGTSRASVVFAILASVVAHTTIPRDEPSSKRMCLSPTLADKLLVISQRLLLADRRALTLEKAQARLVQTMYLLRTSQLDSAWSVFRDTLQAIDALQLHYNLDPTAVDCDEFPMRSAIIRTIFTGCILDTYISSFFGLPRYFSNDYIRMMTEDLTLSFGDQDVCGTQLLVLISQIFASTPAESRHDGQSSESQGVATATSLMQSVYEWDMDASTYVESIQSSTETPGYGRHTVMLTLARAHAVMHINRNFLLKGPTWAHKTQVDDCIAAAKAALQTVHSLIQEDLISHLSWWTHYITFAALTVIYVRVLHERRLGQAFTTHKLGREMETASECYEYLAKATSGNPPRRQYAMVLNDFHHAVFRQYTFRHAVNCSADESPRSAPY